MILAPRYRLMSLIALVGTMLATACCTSLFPTPFPPDTIAPATSVVPRPTLPSVVRTTALPSD